MILRKGKSRIIDDDEKKKKDRVSVGKMKNIDQEQNIKGTLIGEKGKKKVDQEQKITIVPHIPDEIIIEGVLTKLPARVLAKCSEVSKLWNNSIYNDIRFATSHFVHNQNELSIFFTILNVPIGEYKHSYIFRLEDDLDRFKCSSTVGFQIQTELVGYCNGLACVAESRPIRRTGAVTVMNPVRGEALVLTYPTPTPIQEYIHLCYGFGFDSVTQQYKAVAIYSTSEANHKVVCMVITLGDRSWRKIVTCASEIALPPGLSLSCSPMITSIPMITRVSRDNYYPSASATQCRGDLFWRITSDALEEDDNHNEIPRIEILLSFDLHNEKIQFIRLPTETTLTPRINEHQTLVVDHLLEFKGYPCVARYEKINDHCCNNPSNCCCCKIHMYILKDKIKQVWIKSETFDVQIKEEDLLPAPFCCTTIPPRLLTFLEEVILYWFNGECLVFYNLQTKQLKVIKGSCAHPGVFQAKKKESPGHAFGCDRPNMDYQLHAQMENILSLKTFIPKGEIIESKDPDAFKKFLADKSPTGWLTLGRDGVKFHAFF